MKEKKKRKENKERREGADRRGNPQSRGKFLLIEDLRPQTREQQTGKRRMHRECTSWHGPRSKVPHAWNP